MKRNSGALRILGTRLPLSGILRGGNFAGCREMYPRNLARLLACYEAGLPFFRHALEGDLALHICDVRYGRVVKCIGWTTAKVQ
jgi:hypothetical protein